MFKRPDYFSRLEANSRRSTTVTDYNSIASTFQSCEGGDYFAGSEYDNVEKLPPSQSDSVESCHVTLSDLGYSERTINFVFMFILLLDALVNFDHGSVPAGLTLIQKDLGLSYYEAGNFGSLVFLGLGAGSLLSTFLLKWLDYKGILVLSFIGNGVGLLAFSTMQNYSLLAFSRFWCGVFQINIAIYKPLFVDAFSSPKNISYRMSTILLTPSLGVLAGYGLTGYTVMEFQNWRFSFFLMSIFMFVASLFLLMMPGKNLNLNQVHRMREEVQRQKTQIVFMKRLGGTGETQLENTHQNGPSFFTDLQEQRELAEDEEQSRGFTGNSGMSSSEEIEHIQNPEDEPAKELTTWQAVKLLSNDWIYISIVLSLTLLFFVISGIQYWASNYLENILGVSTEQTHIYFMVTCLSAPISGAIFSGHVVGKSVPDYTSPKAISMACFVGTFCIFSAIPVPFVDDFRVAIGLIWFLLFFGSFILPLVTGILLSHLQPEIKHQATSIANLSYNVLGYLPAPSIYGAVQSMSSDPKPRLGIQVLMFAAIPSILLLYLTKCLQDHRRKLQKMEEEAEPIEVIIHQDQPQKEEVARTQVQQPLFQSHHPSLHPSHQFKSRKHYGDFTSFMGAGMVESVLMGQGYLTYQSGEGTGIFRSGSSIAPQQQQLHNRFRSSSHKATKMKIRGDFSDSGSGRLDPTQLRARSMVHHNLVSSRFQQENSSISHPLLDFESEDPSRVHGSQET